MYSRFRIASCFNYLRFIIVVFSIPGLIQLNQIFSGSQLAGAAEVAPGVERVGDVYVLEDASFDDFIKSEPSALVLFWAPWCHWCQEFLPRFAESATLIAAQALPVKFAQIDATRNPRVSDLHSITAFPTLKLFLDGQPHDYSNGFRTTDVVKYVTNSLQSDTIVSDVNQLDAVIAANRNIPIVIGCFDQAGNPGHRHSYVSLSRKIDHVTFAEVNDTKSIAHLIEQYKAPGEIAKVKEWIIVINPHFQRQPEFEPAAVRFTGNLERIDEIEVFVKKYYFPALADFDSDLAPQAFKDGRPIWVMFTDGKHGELNNKRAIEHTREMGQKYRDQMIFILSDGSSIFDQRLQALLDVQNEKFPTVRVINSNPGGHATWYSTLKYRPSAEVLEDFNPKGLEQFIKDFKNDKLKPFVRSEPIPEDDDGPVKTLVALQFDDLIYKSKKDVLVEFHAPWCGHCRKFASAYNKLGEMFRSVKDIEIMKFDATQNEANITIWGYPTLILFTHNASETKMHYYGGDRTIEDIVKFIAETGTVKFDSEALLLQPLGEAQERIRIGDAADWMVEEL